MFTIALTGGIASGKSTVARYFFDLGVTVIDADEIAHQLLCVPAIIEQIIAYFGPAILTADKKLHLPALRNIIFFDSKARDFLEQLLHPLIYKHIQESILTVKSIYCLVVIPLLFEEKNMNLLKKKPVSGMSIELNRIILVASSKKLQIQRAQSRDKVTREQVDAILSLQHPVKKSLMQADDIVCNKTTLTHLHQSVARFHRMYLALAYAKNLVLERSAISSYYLAFK